MRKLRKMVFLLAVGIVAIGLSNGKDAVAGEQEKAAFVRYINENLSDPVKYPYAEYGFYDINKDGTMEMFFQYEYGQRGACKVYKYRKSNGKVIKMAEMNGINGVSKYPQEKAIVKIYSGGADDTKADIYSMKNGKLVKGATKDLTDDRNYWIHELEQIEYPNKLY